MTSNPNDTFDDLRQKAEKRVDKTLADDNRHSNEVLELIHELQIHQAELEVQNDELEISNEKLASMHREYADLYEYAPCGFVTLTPKGIFEHINLKAASLLNMKRGPLTFMAFSNFIAPESEADYFNALKRIEKSGEMQELELRLKNTENNSVKWLHVNIHADNDDNGLLKRWQLSLDDITRRKEAEESLQQTRENLRQIQCIAGVGNVIWYLETGEVIWSDSMFDILGYDKTEIIDYARMNHEIHHPQDRECIEQWIEDCLKSGSRELTPLEYRLIRSDGPVLHVWTTGLIEYKDEKPYRITTTIQDITSDKEKEIKLLEAVKLNKDLLLELQHRAKNSFMTISTMIKIARHDCVSDETAVILDELYSRVKAVFELYNMIYISGSVTEVELDDYINRLTDLFMNASKNVILNRSFEPVTVPVNMAIPVGLIVVELLTNSMKYAYPEDESGTIDISLTFDDATAVISVMDDGPGFTTDSKQDNKSTSGLSLVYLLTEQIDGSLEIESNNGTRCVLTFPVK